MAPRKISIVTPSFNQAPFIEENILSVVNQKYPNLEHIIIDGNSTDGTVGILKRYSHLRWISEPDNGQTHALNKGFRMTTGEIVGWVNSDDTYCPDILNSVAERFNDPAVMVVCGDGYEIDDKGQIIKPVSSLRATPEDLIRYWKWHYEFIQPSFFFRRKVFDEVGYLDESLYYAMDVEFFIRLGKRYKFDYLKKPLANLRYYSTTKTGRNSGKILPGYIREMHTVSTRFWGEKTSWKYYSYLFSFLFAIGWSFVKNILFLPGSKSKDRIKKMYINIKH